MYRSIGFHQFHFLYLVSVSALMNFIDMIVLITYLPRLDMDKRPLGNKHMTLNPYGLYSHAHSWLICGYHKAE
jgi:hypothetical protein